jgi:hypothetical protein
MYIILLAAVFAYIIIILSYYYELRRYLINNTYGFIYRLLGRMYGMM